MTAYMGNPAKILVVDDEETLCEALRFNLEAEGYQCDTALSAEEALGLDLHDYDLVLLDIMMGEISGSQMASIMKANERTARIPIIFCTARDSDDDMIRGLDLGADDYITKPYSLRNVMARIRSVLRRTGVTRADSAPDADTLRFEGVEIHPSRKVCLVDGREVKMPRKEFEILCKLVTHPGQVFSREELLRQIWPENTVVLDRVVDVNVTRLRSKLGPYGGHIVTRPGYGYVFTE